MTGKFYSHCYTIIDICQNVWKALKIEGKLKEMKEVVEGIADPPADIIIEEILYCDVLKQM